MMRYFIYVCECSHSKESSKLATDILLPEHLKLRITFHGLSTHMWKVAILLDNTVLEVYLFATIQLESGRAETPWLV